MQQPNFLIYFILSGRVIQIITLNLWPLNRVIEYSLNKMSKYITIAQFADLLRYPTEDGFITIE